MFVDIDLRTSIEEYVQSILVIRTLMRRTSIALTWREAFAQHNLILSDRHNYIVTSLDGQIITSVDRQVREHIRKFPARMMQYPVVLEYELPERMPHRGVARISSNHWHYAVSQCISNCSMRYAIPMLPLVPIATANQGRQANSLQGFSRLRVDGSDYLLMVNDPPIRDPRLEVGGQPIHANGAPVARIVHSDTFQNQMPADLIHAAVAGNHRSHNIRIPLVIQQNPANYIAFPGMVLPPQNANRRNPLNAEVAPRQVRVNRRGPPASAFNLPGPLPPSVPARTANIPTVVVPRIPLSGGNPRENEQQHSVPPPNEPESNPGENEQKQSVPPPNELDGNPGENDQQQAVPPPNEPEGNLGKDEQEQAVPPPNEPKDNPGENEQQQAVPPPNEPEGNPGENDQQQTVPPPNEPEGNPDENEQEQAVSPPKEPEGNPDENEQAQAIPSSNEQKQVVSPPHVPEVNPGENEQEQAAPSPNRPKQVISGENRLEASASGKEYLSPDAIIPEAVDSVENRQLTYPPDEINPEPLALVINQQETPAQVVNGPEVSVNNGNDMEFQHAGVIRRQPSVPGPFPNTSLFNESVRALFATAVAVEIKEGRGRDVNNNEANSDKKTPEPSESPPIPLPSLKRVRTSLSRESSDNNIAVTAKDELYLPFAASPANRLNHLPQLGLETGARETNNNEMNSEKKRPAPSESRPIPLPPLKRSRTSLSREAPDNNITAMPNDKLHLPFADIPSKSLNHLPQCGLQIEANRGMSNQETTSDTSGHTFGSDSIAAPLAAGGNQNGEIDGNNAPEIPSGENNQEHGILTSTPAGTGRNAAATRNHSELHTELRAGIKKLEQLLGYTVADARAATASATTGPEISVVPPFLNNHQSFENQPMDMDDPTMQREIYTASVSSISSDSEQNYNINDGGRDSAASNGDNETDSGGEEGDEEQISHNDHNYNQGVHQNLEQHDQENNNGQVGDEFEEDENEGENDGAEGNEEIDNNLQHGNGEHPEDNFEENGNGNNAAGFVNNVHQVVQPQPENNIEQNRNLRNLPDEVVEQMRLHNLQLVEPIVPPAPANQPIDERAQGRINGRYYSNGAAHLASRRARFGAGFPVGEYRGRNVGIFNYVGHGAFHPFNRHQGPYAHINGPRGNNPQRIEHSEFCTRQGINHHRRSQPYVQEQTTPSSLIHHAGIVYNLANHSAAHQRNNVPLVQQMPHFGQNQNQDALPNANQIPMHPNPAALADIESYIRPLVIRFGLPAMRETANEYYSLRYTSPELWGQLQHNAPMLCEFLSNLFG